MAIQYVDTSGNIIGSTQSNDLNSITALPAGAAYAVYIDDAKLSSALGADTGNTTPAFTGLVAGQPNKYGIPTATGTLTSVAIPAPTAAEQRQSIMDKYDPQIATARENLRQAVDLNKPATTITSYRTQLVNTMNEKTTALAGVTGV